MQKTVVGVLVEVPIMLLLVNYANRTKHYFKENIDGKIYILSFLPLR
jgi:ACR3 family arsenite efflux pump ArsB